MGENIDRILAEVGDGDEVIIMKVPNENNDFVSYATGVPVYYRATGGLRKPDSVINDEATADLQIAPRMKRDHTLNTHHWQFGHR